MSFKRIGLATDIISLADARTHLRVVAYGSPLAHPDDAYVTTLITTAREWTEEYLGRYISTQTIELALDLFPDDIKLKVDVQSISSVKYINTSYIETSLSNTLYSLDNYSAPAWLLKAAATQWPDTAAIGNAVKVRFVAGYTDGLSINDNPCPKAIIAAMLLIIGSLYENRQENNDKSLSSLPMGVMMLLQPYRLNIGV